MLGWIVLIAAIVFMYRVAENEQKSGILWAALTFVICFLSIMFIPLPLINIGIGVVLSYGTMFVVKLISE